MIRGPTEHVWEPWACLGGVLWCTGELKFAFVLFVCLEHVPRRFVVSCDGVDVLDCYAGNIWVVPIVQCIGLGLGLVLWGSANMLTGTSPPPHSFTNP